MLHFTNAYEAGDEIVLDGFFEGDPSPLDTGGTKWDKLFRFLALDRLQARLHRWRFDLVTGEVREERLFESVTEFGTINPGYAAADYRYVYAATASRVGSCSTASSNTTCAPEPRSGSRSGTASTAARPQWHRASAAPAKTTAT